MKFEVPSSEWLRLSDGLLQFHFSDGWKDATPERLLSSILSRVCDEHPEVDADLDDGTITVSRRHRDERHIWNEVIGTYTIDGGFKYDSWLKEVPPEEFRAEAEAVLTSFVDRTERAFRRQHSAGRCSIYARVSSPLERSFTLIPPDVFAHFAVTDWSKGSAASAAGEKLFSIHAAALKDETPRSSTVEALKDIQKSLPETRAEQFAAWVERDHITRKSGTLDQLRFLFLKSRGEEKSGTIDDKTIRKGFRLVYGVEYEPGK